MTTETATSRILTAEELTQVSGGHNPPGYVRPPAPHNPPGDARNGLAVPPDPY